jgi:hypothetical protein
MVDFYNTAISVYKIVIFSIHSSVFISNGKGPVENMIGVFNRITKTTTLPVSRSQKGKSSLEWYYLFINAK